MRKREQGILTVEASIVLTFMTLFVLFLFSFIRVYRAENMVSHATLQAADAMALESYLRENALDDKATDVVYLANRLTGTSTLNVENFESLRSANVPTIAKEKFVAAVSNSEANANTILTNYGVKNGLSGVDFSTSTVDLDRDDVIVNVSYTLKMQFPIFGATEINVTKSAKAKTFGEILFEITAEPEDPKMGSTSGSGNYQHGTTIQITANPNYGYKFVKWDDGNTQNPRKVSVVDAYKYVAIFEADSFAVITKVSPELNPPAGSASGGGEYLYLSTANLTATANPGYRFSNWSIWKHKDNAPGTPNNSPNISLIVDQIYEYEAIFLPNTYKVKVTTDGTTGADAWEKNRNKVFSITYDKNVSFSLEYLNPTGYELDYWECIVKGKTEKVNANTKLSSAINMISGGLGNDETIEYKAHFKKKAYSVVLADDGNGTTSGGGTVYINGSSVKIKATANSGYQFDRWVYVKTGGLFSNDSDCSVNLNEEIINKFIDSNNTILRLKACFKRDNVTYTLDCKGGKVYLDNSWQIKYSKAIPVGGSTCSLPSPIREGYKFDGWKFDGKTYYAGKVISNITSNITIEAKWITCNHKYANGERSMDGYCGYRHVVSEDYAKSKGRSTNYINWPVEGSSHNASHKCYWVTCVVCSQCGYHELEPNKKLPGKSANYYDVFNPKFNNGFVVSDSRWCGTCAEKLKSGWLNNKTWVDVHSIGEDRVANYLKSK